VNDLSSTLEMAHRIKATGGNLLLDLHYSDTWADPAHQTKPAAWSSLSFTQLQQRVHDDTRDVMQAFSSEGVAPQMVQIGNEISNGMLWGDGYPWSGGSNNVGFDRLAALLNAGINGAKAGAASDEQPLIMLHTTAGHSDRRHRITSTNLPVETLTSTSLATATIPSGTITMQRRAARSKTWERT
jgi:arabinogalactan endo-1,4-beta-galactosidase